jgi:hypothetical protein
VSAELEAGDTVTTLFDAPIWAELAPHAVIVPCARRHDTVRLEFNLPPNLLQRALNAASACVACGVLVHPVRLRQIKSNRSRIVDLASAQHAFYAATCPSNINASCQRTKAARTHMQGVRIRFGSSEALDPLVQVQAYRRLCGQLIGALKRHGAAELALWLRTRCYAIEKGR